MSISEKAVKNFNEKNYNCSQAVVCAYCQEQGIDEDTIYNLARGFGGGMGGMQDTCGAVTGMFMAMGMTNTTSSKAEMYEEIREMAEQFKKECGSLYCRDLKKMENGVQKVSCSQCVETCAKLLDKYMDK